MHRDRERHLPFARITLTAAAALLAGAMGAGTVRADAGAGCTTSTSPTMLTVGAGAAQTRQFDLVAGERLDFTATADQGAAVTIALVSGAGAPRTLFAGETPAATSFTPSEPGAYTFRLEADAPAAVSMRCLGSTTQADMQRAFLARRSDLLMTDTPSRTRIDAKPQPSTAAGPVPGTVDTDPDGRPTRVAFSMSLSELAAVGNPDAKHMPPGILDFWFEGRYESYATALPDGAAGDGRLGVVYLGTKYMLGPDIMLGALAQFDRAGEAGTGEAPTLQASGWMAGPYVSARLGAGFVLDGRAAWGRADESLGAELRHSGARQLLQARLSGNRQIEGWTFAPSLAVRYFEEATAAAPELSSELTGGPGVGRIDLLPEISRRYQVNSDTFVEPRFAVGGFWSVDDLARMPSAHGAMTDVRLKAEAGVSLGVKEGASLSAVGGVEQGAEAAENVWSGQLQLKVPLDK